MSMSGARYFVIFKDDFSGFRVLCPLKQKSEVFDLFKQYVARLSRETGKSVTTLRSDGGGEFTGGDFELYLANEGIRHETSAPHTPQQNGVSERENRTVMEPPSQSKFSLEFRFPLQIPIPVELELNRPIPG